MVHGVTLISGGHLEIGILGDTRDACQMQCAGQRDLQISLLI